MLHKCRSAPEGCEFEVHPGAERLGLSNGSPLDWSIALDVVNDQIAFADNSIQVGVVRFNERVICVECVIRQNAESVRAVLLSGPVFIAQVSVDNLVDMFETVLTVTHGNVLVCCGNGGCSILVALVEIGFIQDAIVRHVQTVCAGSQYCDESKESIYLFHIAHN